MKQKIRRNSLLILFLVLGAILLSVFFWPEWTEWKIRLGIIIVAISLSMWYRERPLQDSTPSRIQQKDPFAIERQRLKNWADGWR